MSTAINQAVGFLAIYAKDALAELKKEYANHAILFEEGMYCGTEEKQDIMHTEPGDGALNAKKALCLVAAKEILRFTWVCTPKIRSKLILHKRIQLSGNVLSALASCGLLSLIFLSSETWMLYIAATVTLFGSLISLTSNHIGTAIDSDYKLIDIYDELVSKSIKAEMVSNKLEGSTDAIEVKKLIEEINNLSGEIMKLLMKTDYGNPLEVTAQ